MMESSRTENLIAKLTKGQQKTLEILHALTPEQWLLTIYTEPPWQVQHLLAHFVSAERQLLVLAQNTVDGGRGVPLDFDVNQYNADEQKRLEGQPVPALLAALEQSRQQTIAWVSTLGPEELDKIGRHPALGEISVETMIAVMHGHHLMHLRDLLKILKT